MKQTNFLTKAVMLMLSLVMVLQLTACGGEGKGTGTNKNEKPAEPERVTEQLFEKRENTDPEIDLLIWWPPKSDIQEINALYQQIYGGKVNVIEKAWGQMTSTVSSYVAAGTPAEVVVAGTAEAPLWAAQGLLEAIPMDKLDAESEYWDFETMNTTFKIKDNVYALSYSDLTGTRFPMLVYNEAMFKKYGVKNPYEHFKDGNWDFDQFRKTAAEMTMDTDDDGFVDLFGFDASLTVRESLVSANASAFLKFSNNKYSLNFDDARVIEALQLYHDMYNIDKSINQTEFKQYQNFLNGRCAMVEVSIDSYAQFYLDGMEKGTAALAIFPSGPSANGKYFSKSSGHVSIGTVTGTNNLDATIAWMECAISVWLELGKDSPRETISYKYTDEEKARIKELNAACISYKDSGLKKNKEGVEGRGFIVANNVTAERMMQEIRRNKSLSTILEQYKPSLQGELDTANAVFAAAK